MKIASVQMRVEDNNKEILLNHAESLIERASKADMIILPELWNIGWMRFDLYHKEAETLEGSTITRLKKKAKEVGSYIHTGSFVEKNKGRYYNTSVIINPQGEIIATYKKIHLLDGCQFQESQILTAGKEWKVVETEYGKFGLAICYDLRFPELFRTMVDDGALFFLICSAWPYPRLEHWIMLNRVRALENQAFLISSNCVGKSRGSQYAGHSMIVDPWGVISASGGDEECILSAEIDADTVIKAREDFPALRDRRFKIKGVF